MKATVDQETCIGCGICAQVCPAVFEMNSNDKSSVKGDNVPDEVKNACRTAAESCPVEAITIEE